MVLILAILAVLLFFGGREALWRYRVTRFRWQAKERLRLRYLAENGRTRHLTITRGERYE